jgi:hypothetical protein
MIGQLAVPLAIGAAHAIPEFVRTTRPISSAAVAIFVNGLRAM